MTSGNQMITDSQVLKASRSVAVSNTSKVKVVSVEFVKAKPRVDWLESSVV